MNIDDAKSKLLELQTELLERTEKIKLDFRKAHDKTFSEQAIERNNDQVLMDLNAEAESELSSIHRALIKIDNGSYGYCEKCEQAINEERLNVIPHADLCVNCMG